jgi:hypothetical protein
MSSFKGILKFVVDDLAQCPSIGWNFTYTCNARTHAQASKVMKVVNF